MYEFLVKQLLGRTGYYMGHIIEVVIQLTEFFCLPYFIRIGLMAALFVKIVSSKSVFIGSSPKRLTADGFGSSGNHRV